MRINSYLAKCGLGSRRKVETLILNKEIYLNGNNDLTLSTQVNPTTDKLVYKGKVLKIYDKKVYIMLYKPKLVLSTVSDDRGRKTVMDILKVDCKLFPVGRLDYNTEGLILLTNDGDFANKVIHPSMKIGKTYEVILKTMPKPIDLVKLRKGIDIGDQFKTLPAEVSNPEKLDNNYYKVIIKIFEGRNRQVRRMFKSVGHSVYSLKRIKIGELELGNLTVGKYKELSKEEINKIFI